MKYKKYIIFTLLLIFVIMYPMAEFTWGDLPKNQTDSQLITQAISQAISDHNDDPTAHMGSGQSIDVHRKNEIIDHPAFSIVADKTQNNVLTFYESFTNISTLSPGTGISQLPLGFRISQTTASQSANREIEYDQFTDFQDDTGSSVLDVTFTFTYSYSGNKTKIHVGADPNTSASSIQYGFTIENGEIKMYTNLNGNNHVSTATAISQNKLHVARWSYDPNTRVMSAYLDGLLIHETTWPATTHGTVDIYSFIFGITRTATLSGSDSSLLTILSLVFTTGYIN